MSLLLTEEQRRALQRPNGEAVRLIDPDTNDEYVLVPADVYARLRNLLYDDSDLDPRRGYALADEVMKEDWDDSKMAEYDRYEEHRSCK